MLVHKEFEKVYTQMTRVQRTYAELMYKKLGELENVEVFETQENNGSVPMADYKPIKKGETWGCALKCGWFKSGFTVPKEWAGKALSIHADCTKQDSLLFVNGKPGGALFHANTPMFDFFYAQPIIDCAVEGEYYDIAVESYAGVPTGCLTGYDCDDSAFYNITQTFNGIDIVERQTDIADYVMDLKIVLQLYDKSHDSFIAAEAMRIIEQVNAAVYMNPYEHDERVWRPALARAREIMKKILSKSETRSNSGEVIFVGHSHLDTAWYWPISDGIRRCARTYSNALKMMDYYPEYTFIQSSALHTEWMRLYYPDIFEGIKERVAEGRYDCNGGVWVECDCNITGGESMIRQFIYGQKFTMEHFGKKSDTFWLPDTFGYSANIPQIMKGCDVKYFSTTKIAWNEINKFPYNSFRWVGIDGTSVLTNFTMLANQIDVNVAIACGDDIADKRMTSGYVVPFGHGDGGGGPDFEVLDSYSRIKDLNGIPKSKIGTVTEFMERLDKELDDPIEYDGELYLEFHRGTLTNQHDIKRNNRKAEVALHDLEFANAIEMATKKGGKRDKIEEQYKVLLLNQFHDILPGSSIPVVHVQAKEEVSALIKETLSDIETITSAFGKETGTSFMNSLSWERTSQFTVSGKITAPNAITEYYTDIHGNEKTAVGGLSLAPLSISPGNSNKKLYADDSFTYDGKSVETPFASFDFDENGYIINFIDKIEHRRLDRTGTNAYPLGAFITAEDIPLENDNWNIDANTENKYVLETRFKGRKLISNGRLQLRLRSEWAIGTRSRIVCDLICYADTQRIDFETVMYWQDRHLLLKAVFDVDLRVTEAKNEIQLGFITRPTTRNNSIEAAKFEVCNHKWTDISESRYGVALLNDSKYGVSMKNARLALTLHKAGTIPDYTGDAGVHDTTYSFMPHQGGFTVPTVTRPAYELNHDVRVSHTGAELPCLAQIDCDNVIIETIKPAEDGTGIVLRLYEAEKYGCKTVLRPGFAYKNAYVTNMLEEIDSQLECGVDGGIELTLGAFEIKTIKFVL
ncbi:MAG: alpha-mannosidase [Clostridiales bacterium]|nr:alpha-mannosidase [Clostridiales bacterium]